jgi:Domain of unknown function (DUF4329)
MAIEPDAHVAEAELGAVWYAANQYYEASFKNAVEYVGIVFKRPDGKYVVTAHRGNSQFHCQVPNDKFPGFTPTAVWHTHVPLHVADPSGEAKGFLDFIESASAVLFGGGRFNLSGPDKEVADILTERLGWPFAVYAVTMTTIKRYRPGSGEKEWVKDPPSRMRKKK